MASTFPKICQDPSDPSFVQNPYRAYRDWREAPFYFWQDYGFLVSARFDVVNALLRDRRFGREAPQGFAPPYPKHLAPFYEFENRSMLEREPPTHTRLRALVLKAFTSRRIAGLEADINALCDTLLAQFPDTEFDLIKHYAEILPVIIIARLIGVDEQDAPQLLRWSHDMVAMYQANRDAKIEARAVQATLEFQDYIGVIANARQNQPKDDLISHLLDAEANGDKLTRDELITTVILLLNAGHEATVHALANGVKTCLENGFILTTQNAESASEELLRIDPPLHMFTRYAMEDAEVMGYKFQKGEQVGLLLGAANHDPEKYPNPEIFDPMRKSSDHTSFGAGLHFCIGAPLARLEMRIALGKLFARYPKLEIARTPIYADRYHFHGLEALWLKT